MCTNPRKATNEVVRSCIASGKGKLGALDDFEVQSGDYDELGERTARTEFSLREKMSNGTSLGTE